MENMILKNEVNKIYKNDGNLKTAVKYIKDYLHIMPNIFKSWKGLLTFTELIESNFINYKKDEYFISEKHRLAFFILKNEKNAFDDELGITRKHYLDKELAKEWRNKMLNKFHPDKDIENLFENNEITQKINKMYKRMTGEA